MSEPIPHVGAYAVACPTCHAEAGAKCRWQNTGEVRPAHPARILAAVEKAG